MRLLQQWLTENKPDYNEDAGLWEVLGEDGDVVEGHLQQGGSQENDENSHFSQILRESPFHEFDLSSVVRRVVLTGVAKDEALVLIV